MRAVRLTSSTISQRRNAAAEHLGARNADEAVRIARLSRACGCGDFVKIEIMRDSKYLLPDNQETIRATEILANEGFVVMPYMYPDLNVARRSGQRGRGSIMPLAVPSARTRVSPPASSSKS